MGLNDMKEDEVLQEEAPEGEGVAEHEGEGEGDLEKPAGEGEESQDGDGSGDEDPLAGLDDRLAKLDLDDAAKAIIKRKLEQFNDKIKVTVEEREKELEEKLAGGKKKK